ncbi:hypothetical protein HK101_010716 [Irineochytrium annulatum]|nr:hypothetical protein HK101_010716 [Irineochytrium annulatum]
MGGPGASAGSGSGGGTSAGAAGDRLKDLGAVAAAALGVGRQMGKQMTETGPGVGPLSQLRSFANSGWLGRNQNQTRSFSILTKQGSIANPLVTTDWLQEKAFNNGSRKIVILDGTWHMPATKRKGSEEFLKEHIKGARFFDIDEASDHTNPLPHMLPTAEDFAKYVGALGISNDSHVVIYDATSAIGSAARVLWTFRVFGHSGGVSVLDGGLPKWKAEGREVVSGPAEPVEPATYTPKYNPALVKSFDQVRENLFSENHTVVDARPAGRFNGTDPEPRPIPSGHIPRSISIPSGLLMDPASSTLLRAQALSSVFKEKGVGISDPVIHTCGSGVNASIGWLATVVARMGVEPGTWEELEDGVSVYDGSWTEWAGKEKDGAEIDSRGGLK